MAIFGLVSQKQHEELMKELEAVRTSATQEIEAVKASAAKYEKWMLETAENESRLMPDPSVYGNQADLYRVLSWVLLAVDITASSAALTPFSVARIISGKEPKDIPNHDFEILLNHPNDLDSRFEFLYATIAYYKLNGNSYWFINSKDENSPPDEMWVIPPEKIIPVPDKKLYLKGYMYYPGNGREIFLETHQIVHFKRFNPASRFIGLSAIEAIALVAAGDLGMQKYNTTLFGANNGRLPSVMTFEQMVADPTWEKIKQDTREASKNREMLMLRGVGTGGVNWLQNSVSQRDMEFLAGRKANKEEIMSTIAPGSFTMLSENATQANSVVGRASFNELTVYPAHIMMNEKITNSILPRYGGRQLVGRFEDVRVTDKEMKLREQEAFERTHTLKEVREEIYGDAPLGDDRDELLIAELGKSTPKEEPPVPPVVNNVKPDEVMREQPDTEPQDEAMQEIKADLEKYQRKALKKIGSLVEFSSGVVPQYMLDKIAEQLPACKTSSDVAKVFKNVNVIDEAKVAVTLDALRAALRYQVKG